jgi:hypothetical protein
VFRQRLNSRFRFFSNFDILVIVLEHIEVVMLCWVQVLLAASTVGKQTTALCNACRVASSTTNNPVAKRHFVQSAKDVAVSTANLVRAIKVLSVLLFTSFTVQLLLFVHC